MGGGVVIVPLGIEQCHDLVISQGFNAPRLDERSLPSQSGHLFREPVQGFQMVLGVGQEVDRAFEGDCTES